MEQRVPINKASLYYRMGEYEKWRSLLAPTHKTLETSTIEHASSAFGKSWDNYKFIEGGVKQLLSHSYFLEALCCKKLGKYEESNRWYKMFMKLALRNRRRDLTKYIWGLILLPIVPEKKDVINHIENVKDIFEFYAFEQPIDLISKLYDYRTKTWPELKFEKAVDYFKSWNFFKNFSDQELKEAIPKIQLEKFAKDNVIFINEDYVHIILEGQVLLYDVIEIKTLYKPGDVLGSKFDGQEVLHPESWLVTRCDVVTAKVSTEDFELMWNRQMSHKKSKFIPLLQSWALLKNLSEQRIHILLESMQRRLYKPGSLIVAQSKRSHINFQYNRYFVTRPKGKVKKKIRKGDDSENEEDLKSSFQKAIAKFAPKSHKVSFGTVSQKKIAYEFLGRRQK